MKVMLVDDKPILRGGMASLLRSWDYQVVGEVGSDLGSKVKVCEVSPDLVLLDIGMNGVRGCEAISCIRGRYPAAKIIVLSSSEDEDECEGRLLEAIKWGAHGYISKDLEPPELLEALRAIERGEAILPPQMVGKLLNSSSSQAIRLGEVDATERLRIRQQEVLGLVVQGLTNKEVASKLFISENTVKTYMRTILSRLQVQSRTQLIALSNRHSQNGQNGYSVAMT